MDVKKIIEFYSKKKILITGHTGFKGSWLTSILSLFGGKIMGYSLPPEKNSHFNFLDLEKNIVNEIADIKDYKKLKNKVDEFKPEIVFHLAAQALVKKSYDDPLDTYNTNIIGSTNILEIVRQSNSIKTLVFITSDKCYENVEWIWGYRENDRLGGFDPYSSSKACAEVIFSSYLRSFFIPNNIGAASARAGNVIGGGDYSENRIIPDCIKSITSNIPIKLRSPNATRPWQHVLEPLYGYIKLGYFLSNDPSKYSGSWNFGPSTHETRTVQEVANSIVKTFNKGEIVVENSENFHEAQLLQLNCDKANQLLKWFPKWDVDKTLNETAKWYKLVYEGNLPKEITIKQIKNYLNF